MKKVLLLLLCILPVAMTGCGTSGKTIRTPQRSIRTVDIVAVNDMHAALTQFPRFAYMVDSLRKIYPELLLFSGGDNQTGNPINDQYVPKGRPMIELMNAMRFDLSAVGNHEFDSRPEGFLSNNQTAKFDWVCANVTQPADKDYRIKTHKIFSLPNGVLLGVSSVIAINEGGIPDTHPDNAGPFAFSDPYQAAAGQLALKDKCDVLIFVNHMGVEGDEELAKQLPAGLVPLIIGGHSHTKIDHEMLVNGTLITQAQNKLKYMTLIRLTLHPDGRVDKTMKLIPIDAKAGAEDPAVKAMVDKYYDNPVMSERVAESSDDFSSYEQLGYLMADALKSGTEAEIALVNPGGVRMDSWRKGDILVRDVYELDPFGNEMMIFNLSGKELKALYMGAYSLDSYLPIYASGMNSRYHLDADKKLVNVELFVDGKPIDEKRIYKVAMNGYIGAVYQYEHQDKGKGLFRPTADNMIDYLKKIKTISSYRQEKRVEIVQK